MPDSLKTYVSVLTPCGTAAIAVLGIYGPLAPALVLRYFRTKRPFSSANNNDSIAANNTHIDLALPYPVNQAIVGYFDDGYQRDDVVLLARANIPSPLIELHCHGGSAVLEWIIKCLCRAGATSIPPNEWCRITESEPIRQAAMPLLSQTTTLRTAAIVLDQIHGAWTRTLSTIDTAIETDPALARRIIERLVQLVPVGKHLCQPFHVALAGAPNTGKSTLLNALTGYHRAITSPVPGTTRDVLTADIALDGWPVQLIDTAGWRHTDDILEREGLARAQQSWLSSDLILWLLDISSQPVLPPAELTSILYVVNKLDLEPQWQPKQVLPSSYPFVLVSAKTGEGLERLCHLMSSILVPYPPEPGEAVPFTSKLCKNVLELQELAERKDWAASKAHLRELFLP